MVCAWYGLRGENGMYFAHVLNGSGLPVYDVTVQFSQVPPFYQPDSELSVLDQVPLGVLPPGQVLVPLTEALRAGGLATEEFTAGVTFRDSSNNYWRRLPNGILKEATTSQPPAAGAPPRTPLKVRLRRALGEKASRRAGG